MARCNSPTGALKRLCPGNSASGVPTDTVDRLRKMFGFLDDMGDT